MTRPTADNTAVALDRLVKRYGAIVATDEISLEVRTGEFLSLLGPSGSGKTTLLMLLAGFETADSGTIRLHGRDISRVPPNKRDIGMVFQRYALFPHMSVAQNVAFPLKMRGVPKRERLQRAAAALDLVKLDGYADRMPAQLSGGQQQRVALARAIVFEPKVLLMDEPLGALDRRLRQHMQVEIKDLQRRLNATVVYVTHDQEEALAMSDRVAIVNHGRIEQLDVPRMLYERPQSAFVGDFVGEINLLDANVVSHPGPRCVVSTPNGELTGTALPDARFARGDRVCVGIRPERLVLATGAPSGRNGGFSATVRQSIFNGNTFTIHATLEDGSQMRVVLMASAAEADLPVGSKIALTAAPDDVFVFRGSPR